MAKQMKTWNGYEIVDDAARKDIVSLEETIDDLQTALIGVSELIGGEE